MPYHFEHIPGFFSLTTWDKDIDNHFGRVPPDWSAFKAAIADLQAGAPPGEKIKVIYTARHGEAEHNVLAKKYPGIPEDIVQQTHPITDPKLTEAGREQAVRLGNVFKREAGEGMPLPTRWFVSPMRRPGETAGLEWEWLFPGKASKTDLGHGVPGECVEELREHLHVHHCDERLPLRELRPLFPSFTFPATSPDDDLVWRPKSVRGRETEDEMVARAGKGLAIVMDMCTDDDVYISITAHSGVLRAVYKNLHIPLRRLVTGEMNVLVVRVKEVAAPCTCVYHRFVHHLL